MSDHTVRGSRIKIIACSLLLVRCDRGCLEARDIENKWGGCRIHISRYIVHKMFKRVPGSCIRPLQNGDQKRVYLPIIASMTNEKRRLCFNDILAFEDIWHIVKEGSMAKAVPVCIWDEYTTLTWIYLRRKHRWLEGEWLWAIRRKTRTTGIFTSRPTTA